MAQKSIAVRDSSGNFFTDLIQGILGPILSPIQQFVVPLLVTLVNFLYNVNFWWFYTIVGVVFQVFGIDANSVAGLVQEIATIVDQFFAVFTGTTLI